MEAASPVSHLQLSEHGVVIDAGEEHPHGVSAVVQVRDAGSVQITRQLVDVRLQLCEGCVVRKVRVLTVAERLNNGK